MASSVRQHAQQTTPRGLPPRLAIVDWGIGGYGLYALVKATQPALAVTYFSDAGTTPYGKLPPRELHTRLCQVVAFLAQQQVTHVAIACNAASTALPLMAPKSRVQSGRSTVPWPQISGVLEHGARAVQRVRGTIGVVGGRRTILSQAYRRRLPNARLQQRIAQPISAFIERGELHSPALTQALDTIMQPLAEVEALVLACTHYPAIAAQWALRAPRARVIDPAAAMWQWMQRAWPIAAFARGPDRHFSTGAIPQMRRAARAAFGVKVNAVTRVVLR